MQSTLDHIIIVVADLERATRQYSTLLGRGPSWTGRHPGLGTQNTLFRLENTYLELLATGRGDDAGHGPGTDFVRHHLNTQGEGLAGLVFGADDADAMAAHLRDHGVPAAPPMDGEGCDAVTGAIRRWRNVLWPQTAARGVFSFGIQHHDADALPLAPPQDDAHLSAVDHVVVITASAASARRFYGEALGLRLALELSKPEWGGDLLFFRTNQLSIEVMASAKADPETDRLWGLAFKTDDLAATHQRLRKAGVKISPIRTGRKPGTEVATVDSHCLGIPTLLVGLTATAP